jgi:hypothetical protein
LRRETAHVLACSVWCIPRVEVFRHMHRVIAALAVVALSLAACGSSSSGSTTPDPTVAFCPALDTYARSLAKLEALTPASSLADYTAAVTSAKAALAAVKLVAGPFAGAQLSDLQTAQAQLEAAASDLGANATPADAESGLSDELTAVTQEAVLTYNAICNTHPTPSS